jgi:hypothetical protein
VSFSPSSPRIIGCIKKQAQGGSRYEQRHIKCILTSCLKGLIHLQDGLRALTQFFDIMRNNVSHFADTFGADFKAEVESQTDWASSGTLSQVR